jgi:hypothetical protein
MSAQIVARSCIHRSARFAPAWGDLDVFALFLFACGQKAPSLPAGEWANVAPARVEQVLRGEGRAYLHVVEGQYTFWASIPDTSIEPGQFVLLGKGPMRYAVRGGGRLFDALTLIEAAAVVDEATANAAARLPRVDGGVDIAGVYADRRAGRVVRLRGRIVKASKNIEETNWYHVQDGSRGPGDGEDDLTFTAHDDYAVGDTVVLDGPLTIDKDLGFGYFYAAILEDPKVVRE